MPNVKQIAIRKPSVGSTRDAPGAAVSFAAVKSLQADLRGGKIVRYFLIRPIDSPPVPQALLSQLYFFRNKCANILCLILGILISFLSIITTKGNNIKTYCNYFAFFWYTIIVS